MPVLERDAIGSVAIDEINNDLRHFRDLSTSRNRRGMDAYAGHAVINQPHAIMLFEDVGDFRIAHGSLTTHPKLEQHFNYSRTLEGKSKSRKMKSGVVFSTKANPTQELIRLDILKEDITPQTEQLVTTLSDQGFIIFDAKFSKITFEKKPTED